MRKPVEGAIRNKSVTKKRLLDAVDEIILTEGHQSLTITKVAELAGVNKKLIYVYFRSLNGLISAYFKEYKNAEKENNLQEEILPKEELALVLEEHILYPFDDFESQNNWLWQLNESNEHTKHLAKQREINVQSLLKNIQKELGENADALLALLFAGTQFLQLYTQSGNGKFYGLDFSKNEDKGKLQDVIEKILHSQLDVQLSENQDLKKKKKKKKNKK